MARRFHLGGVAHLPYRGEMRAAIVATLAIVTPAVAHADGPRPFPALGVWRNTVKPASGGARALTSVSHTLYLDDCKPDGCTVLPGGDDARTNHSSLAQSPVVLSPFDRSAELWDQLVQCVKDTFAPIDIEIVTEDPGSAPHFEVMIGGTPDQLNPDIGAAGGIAPFSDCGTGSDNVISFVFNQATANLAYLCQAVAQEASHVWGLDHEMNPDDPLTYLEIGTSKRFQDDDARCGEFEARDCWCGPPTQNSVQFLTDAFGPGKVLPASVAITSPADGAWLEPGFPVRIAFTSQLGVRAGQLSIDGATTQTIDTVPIVFNAPADLGPGDHAVEVAVTDLGDRTATAAVTVHVLTACSAEAPCPSSFACLGGVCLPGADQPGGLGATCSEDQECSTGQCPSDGTDSYCAGACDPGAICPSGFRCIADSGPGVCWPDADGAQVEPGDEGGCTTGRGGGLGFLLVGLGALGLARRRRDR